MNGSRFASAALLVMFLVFWVFALKTGVDASSASSATTPVFLTAIIVYALRVSDMTLDTLRVLFMMRGRKLLAGLVGFLQASIFIVAITQVMKGGGVPHVYVILGYAAGFATGIMVGMTVEERLALGYASLRVISKERGQQVAEALRGAGHAATVVNGSGKDGVVVIVNCTVRRKDIPLVQCLVQDVDPESFVTVDEVRSLARGHFRF